MVTQQDIGKIVGATAYDPAGAKIGQIGQVYLDERTGEPTWITVRTGLFGMKENFVPLDRSQVEAEGNIRVPYEKDRVKDAPSVGPEGGRMTESEVVELYRFYGLDADRPLEGDGKRRRTAEGRRMTGRTETDDAMTRSEERLRTGTEEHEIGRARLRKYIVTEEVQKTVPVSREKARIEREPITEQNKGRAMTGPELSEDEHEVVLHEQRAKVQKETVPVERVRLSKENVPGEETVSETLRKEQIEYDEDDKEPRRR
jgi:uncharacterized protein (TIGR02271 family)